jgi:DNA-binding CsgD family transcriptional regulator
MVDDVAHGQGAAVFIQGPAGIGKSRLLEESLVPAAERGLRVFRGVGTGGLVECCAEGPAIIVLDDLHRADDDTILAAYRLSRVVDELPLLVIGTCRPSRQSPLLARLVQSTAERESPPILLGPLGGDDVAALVHATLGVEAGPQLASQVAAAGGNPALVTELVAAHMAAGTGDVDLRATYKRVILAHVDLPTDTFDTVAVASAFGDRFTMGDLAQVLERSAVSLAPNLREALQAGVLGEGGDRLEFRSELVRQALYDQLPPARRSRVHQLAAGALIRGDARATLVAQHFLRAATVGPAGAWWLLRAADEVEVAAPLVSEDLRRCAAELSGDEFPALTLLADLLAAIDLVITDRPREAAAIFTHLGFTIEERRLLVDARRGLLVRCFLGGTWDDAVAAFDPNDGGDSCGVRALIAIHRGDLVTAAATLRPGALWSCVARALLSEATGSAVSALEVLSGACHAGDAFALGLTGPDIVRLALVQGLDGLAREVAGAVEFAADGTPADQWIVGACLRCRGLVDGEPRLLAAAGDVYADAGRPLQAAAAREDAAALLGHIGERAGARSLFEQAIAGYEALGASWDGDRAASRMRACGIRRSRVNARPTLGWSALTPSEWRVVELVAEGMSNLDVAERLFVSRQTVKAHLSSALRKLSLTSRIELAAAMGRRLREPD